MEFHGIAPPVIFNISGLPVTNTILAAWLAIIVLLGLWMMRRLSVGGQPPRILAEVQEPAP